MFSALEPYVELLRDYKRSWFICGGWAIDLFLDKKTREHHDVDIGFARKDQQELRRYLDGWTLHIAPGDGRLVPWREGEYLELPLHCIWGERQDGVPPKVEILLNEIDESLFSFRRDLTITRQQSRAILMSASDLPILAPEIVLLYKSKYWDNEKESKDLKAVLPHLDTDQREWLRNALVHIEPEHPWLALI